MYQSLENTNDPVDNPIDTPTNDPTNDPTDNTVESLIIDIENMRECCICLELNNNSLINVQDIAGIKRCRCFAYVHTDCLIKWYQNKRNHKCIICNSLIITTSQTNRQIEPLPLLSPLDNRRINRCDRPCRFICYAVVIICFMLFVIIVNPDVFSP